jgi:hypothetical protein
LAPFPGDVPILSDYRQKIGTTLVASFEDDGRGLGMVRAAPVVDKSEICDVFSLYNDITVQSINIDVTIRSSPPTY